MNTADHAYIVIAGTSKAGTGSLFRYLGDHVDVCPSNIKETRFFFDQEEFELAAAHGLAEGIEKYDMFFTACPAKPFRLEATPDYLYSPRSARWIRDSLPRVYLVFILRNPVQRLISWYRFGKQQGQVHPRLPFQTFVTEQLEASDVVESGGRPQISRILEQGRYSRYLAPYLDAFPRSSIHVLRFEDMAADEERFVKRLAVDIGLNPEFYRDYRFGVHHRTHTFRYPGLNKVYVEIRKAVRLRTHSLPWAKKTLAIVRGAFESVYLPLATRSDELVTLSPDLKARLQEYYAGEETRLSQMLGMEWKPW